MSQLKQFKEWFSDYENADLLQTISLILFVLFFVAIVVYVYTKPKNYYKKDSKLPLDNEEFNRIKK